MKLTESNKDDNRAFHDLAEEHRLEFLLQGFAQVVDPTKIGPFTPAVPSVASTLSREERQKLFETASKLNFLMTRFNMLENSEYDGRIRELALLRFEYLFLTAQTDLTQDPAMIATFFQKRGKPHLIQPALERLGAEAIAYEHLSKRIIDSSVFEQHVGATAQTYKFRARLHALTSDDDCSKEQTATRLIAEGFDLTACDFNRWYKVYTDYDIKSGNKQYGETKAEKKWLADFLAKVRPTQNLEERIAITPASNDEPQVPKDDEDEDPCTEYNCSKEGIEELFFDVKDIAVTEGTERPPWISELAPLVSDHESLILNPKSLVEAKMWDYLWGGSFVELAHQLKGASAIGRTYNGLNYNRWALLHEQHGKTINAVLAQDSYAMIIAADILVGRLTTAKENMQDPNLQQYKNPAKLRAAINLAWEEIQHPGHSDDSDGYEPPRNYLFSVAKEFGQFLGNAPSAVPYLRLINATNETKLTIEEEQILRSITSFERMEAIYATLGRASELRARFLESFDQRYDNETEFSSLWSEISGLVATVQDPVFLRHVDRQTIGDHLYLAIQRTLQRKNSTFPEEPAGGREKLILTMYSHPVLKPYLEGRVKVAEMLNGMIDDLVDGDYDLLTKPVSVRHQAEIVPMISGRTLETYLLADKYRAGVDPVRMQRLVALLLTETSEMTSSNGFHMSLPLNEKGQAQDAYQPDFFPDENLDYREQRIEFLSKVYEREKGLGGLNQEMISTGITNVIFRGNYVCPNRFYPHVDCMLQFLGSPIADVLPTKGPGSDAIKEYRILHHFLKTSNKELRCENAAGS